MKAWQVVIWLLIGGILGALALAGIQRSTRQMALPPIPPGGPKGPSGSPVTVRGGSMTIRTGDKANGWQSTKLATTYCTYIPTSADLSLSASPEVVSANIPGDTPITSASPVPLTGNWTVTILGRDYKPGDSTHQSSSNSGITLQGTNSACKTASSGQKLVALTANPSDSDFYKDDLGLHEESNVVTAKRYMNTTSASASTNCSGPNLPPGSPGVGNEDSCERASLITVITASSGSPYSGRCRNGECIITIDSH
jgi:hypothetical protein